jgi:hypothetical protein
MKTKVKTEKEFIFPSLFLVSKKERDKQFKKAKTKLKVIPSVKITLVVTAKGFVRTLEYKGKTFSDAFEKTSSGAKSVGIGISSIKGFPKWLEEHLPHPYDLMREMQQTLYVGKFKPKKVGTTRLRNKI